MNGHNPDILTCLANLSANEVFTPPKLAAAMLDILPQDLFRRPDTTFLDPVCKSGVFLREIARRLNDGLKDEMPDEQARINQFLQAGLRAGDRRIDRAAQPSERPSFQESRRQVRHRNGVHQAGWQHPPIDFHKMGKLAKIEG